MRFSLCLLLVALLPSSLTYAAEGGTPGPADIVSAVVKLDRGSWGTVFSERPTPLMRRYFTDGFNASWASAMTHNKDEPVMDGDPITGWQGVTKVVLRSAKATQTGETASATANVMVFEQGEKVAKPESIAFVLKREGGVWKIDDIADPGMLSLRAYFKQNYKS